MTTEEFLIQTKDEIIGVKDTITSVEEAEVMHSLFIETRTAFFKKTMLGVMPHYRGEQNFGWDIRSGIFRPPLNVTDPVVGKQLEQQAITEFESVIRNSVGPHVFRNLFDKEKHGKDWDLLFQAQHAGIKTTLTDWSAEIISALYFATEESTDPTIENADGQLWCYLVPDPLLLGHNNWPVRETFYDMNPYDLDQTYLINVGSYLDNIEKRIFEYRMYRQKGRFVMSAGNNCHIPLNKQDYIQQFIFRFRIPQEFKKTIREDLAKRDMVRKNMYIDEAPARQELITGINAKIFAGY